MKKADKKIAGAILDRGGIASRIICLADDIAQGTFKNAIEKAGQIAELVEAASYDEYWNEKANIGRRNEQHVLSDLIGGALIRDKVAHNANPYDA